MMTFLAACRASLDTASMLRVDVALSRRADMTPRISLRPRRLSPKRPMIGPRCSGMMSLLHVFRGGAQAAATGFSGASSDGAARTCAFFARFLFLFFSLPLLHSPSSIAERPNANLALAKTCRLRTFFSQCECGSGFMGRGGGGGGRGGGRGFRVRGGSMPRTIMHRPHRENEEEKSPEELQVEHDASQARYAAYASRAARVLKYAASVGEAGKAVVKQSLAPKLLLGAQVVTGAYIVYDVSTVARAAPPELELRQGSQQLCYQTLSSLVVPALVLRFAMPRIKQLFSSVSSLKVRRLGPLALGLCLIPAFPYFLDVPIERLTEATWSAAWPLSPAEWEVLQSRQKRAID